MPKRPPKPPVKKTVFPMEPLTIGEIIDRTLKLYVENIKDYLILTAIFYSPSIFINFLIFFIAIFIREEWIVNIAQLIATLIGMVVWSLLLASCVDFTSRVYRGEDMGFLKSLKDSLPKMIPVILMILIVIFIIAGVIMLTAGIITAMVFMFSTAKTFAIIASFIFGLVGIYFALYFSFKYKLAPYLIVLEDRDFFENLKRSTELFYSGRDSQMKIIIVPFLFQLLVLAFIWVPFISFIAVPLPIIAMVLIYYDIRVRSEGFDIETEAEKLYVEPGRKLDSLNENRFDY